MFFTKLGTWVAAIGSILSAFNIGFSLVLAFDPSQTVMPNIGGTIDLNIYIFGSCLVLGVLCEISKGISDQKINAIESD